jgi:succinate dehydrogenase / fumarate reductase cytochrome b subunit
MSWVTHFLTSSLGQKLVMSLTGLFLILFLVVHLAGNLQLLAGDNGMAFNVYARFMTTNPLIKASSYLLYAFILIHTIQGLLLWRQNRQARGNAAYAVKRTRAVNTSAALSSRMGWLGVIILVFILIHLYQFWLQMKLGNVAYVVYPEVGEPVKNLYALVTATYANPGFVAFYVFSMAVIGLHLWHGFQSAFQSLGLNHRKYSPAIRFVGKVYSIVIPALFALIPLYMYLNLANN